MAPTRSEDEGWEDLPALLTELNKYEAEELARLRKYIHLMEESK